MLESIVTLTRDYYISARRGTVLLTREYNISVLMDYNGDRLVSWEPSEPTLPSDGLTDSEVLALSALIDTATPGDRHLGYIGSEGPRERIIKRHYRSWGIDINTIPRGGLTRSEDHALTKILDEACKPDTSGIIGEIETLVSGVVHWYIRSNAQRAWTCGTELIDMPELVLAR